jgi:hypothetical protein
MAADLRSGSESPISVDHDARRTILRKVVNVELRRTDSRSLGIWVDGQLDEDDLLSSLTGLATQSRLPGLRLKRTL